MQDKLSYYINQLLYTQSRFSLPGLGSFEVQHAPALVDQVQGQVIAPAKTITFNTNLVMDDGILATHIAQVSGEPVSVVKKWIDTELSAIQSALDRREIVELPGVGRFFRNFEQQLQFVAENENFNLDSYGLQPVAAYPVARPQGYTPPGSSQAPPSSSPTVPRQLSVNRQWIWWVMGTIILAAFSWFIASLLHSTEAPSKPQVEVPRERLNASPSKELETDTPAPPQVRDSPSPQVDTEAPTLAPDEHTAVIAVGLFGNEDNVQRLVQQLSEQGFAPLTSKEGQLTRVGVAVRYSEESELRETLNDLRRLYTKSAFIMSRDGKKVADR
ncbi:MAG: hypothetical protein D6772_17220 [Bacteroidetes bacterium]|nr:MAG: hypothetical protein D6772_17220 [Bacteroidota bacterium]